MRGGATWTEADREAFLMGMFNNAMAIAPGLARELDALLAAAGLPGMAGRARLLDLGGGPGTYAIHFCLAHPGLSATVVRPAHHPALCRGHGRALRGGRPGGLRARRLHRPGGPRRLRPGLALPDPARRAPDTAAAVVAKAAAALAPGGLLLVHEFLLDDDLDGPEHATLFSLNMLLGTEGGQAYSWRQVEDMLADAGLADIRRLGFAGPQDSESWRGARRGPEPRRKPRARPGCGFAPTERFATRVKCSI